MNPRIPRQILIYATLLLLFCGVSQARIGENYDELMARYGKPTGEVANEQLGLVTFEKEGFCIEVGLVDNRAEFLGFSCNKKERTTLSEYDVKALLDKNIGSNKNAEWHKGSLVGETQYYFLKKSEGIYAKWRMEQGCLEIMTAKGKIQNDACIEYLKKTEANKKLKAF